MKREDLKANGLTDEQIEFVMAEHGKDIETNKVALSKKDEKIESLTKERDGLKTQVEDRNKDIADMKKNVGDNQALAKTLDELKSKYETETANLKKELEEQSVDYAIKSMFNGLEFTSALAKKAAIAEFKATQPTLKDGKFTSAGEFINGLRENNPDAFPKAVEENSDSDPHLNPALKMPLETKLPKFSSGMKTPEQNGGKSNPFNFQFTAVRNPKKE